VAPLHTGRPVFRAPSQPPVNPALSSPTTRWGHRRIRFQMRPVRKFSIIKTMGPWLMPKWNGETHNWGGWDLSPIVALKVALNP